MLTLINGYLPVSRGVWREAVMHSFLHKWCKGVSHVDDLRTIVDWEYYFQRLSGTVQKIITIPAAMQKVHTPCICHCVLHGGSRPIRSRTKGIWHYVEALRETGFPFWSPFIGCLAPRILLCADAGQEPSTPRGASRLAAPQSARLRRQVPAAQHQVPLRPRRRQGGSRTHFVGSSQWERR